MGTYRVTCCLREGGQYASLPPCEHLCVEEFAQFLKWAGPVIATHEQAPLRHLASYWYDGLITILEGRLIEEGRMLV